MQTINKKTNITNIVFAHEIKFPEDVEHFTEIEGVYPIPAQSIIYKTVTGIGATHSEIVAPRNSIIVLPHISIVTSKHEYYKEKLKVNTFAVYGEISQHQIFEYLRTCQGHVKLLTTPKGLNKIINVMKYSKNNGEDIPYKSIFFLLIDECHKIVQDAFYRTDMVELMEHFFEFDNKAMVSATPIPPSDPRFRKQGFKHIKVTPEYDFKQDVELIHADSLVNGLQSYLRENESDHYCIFFNSIVGINSLIKQLDLVNDYHIFCAKQSTDELKVNRELNASFNLEEFKKCHGEFKKYNFFTSSFFNGLDIILKYKPNIVMLTDCSYKDHTMLDPYTDILQIIGRFRKQDKKELPYNKITHINNAASKVLNPISEEQALLKVQQSKCVYDHIYVLKKSLANDDYDELFEQALSTVKPYAHLLKKDGEFCHFLFDNYMDDERVKNYYQSASALRTAYSDTKLYNIINKREIYEKSERIKLQKKSLRYSPEMNRTMAQALLELEDYKGIDVYNEQRAIIEKLSPLVFKAYDRLGYDMIKSFGFKKTKIEKAVLKLDIAEGKNFFPLFNLMHSSFNLNQYYPVNVIKVKIQEIFDEF